MLCGSKAKILRKYHFRNECTLPATKKHIFTMNVTSHATKKYIFTMNVSPGNEQYDLQMMKKQLFFSITPLYLVFFINFARGLICALPITNLQTTVWNEF